MILSQNKTFLFFFLTSSLAIAGAYVAEFIFELAPCQLCLYERIPYFVIILASLIGTATYARFMRYLCLLALLINAGLSLYHTAVEFGWVKDRCSASINTNISTIEEVLADLSGEFTTSCGMPEFVFLGISMAGWNLLYCLFLFLLGILIFKDEKKSAG
jgi:disulfide bond formation protein DsbB